jgi:hypothetical protein
LQCLKCGTALPAGSRFCFSCGSALREEGAETVVEPGPKPPAAVVGGAGAKPVAATETISSATVEVTPSSRPRAFTGTVSPRLRRSSTDSATDLRFPPGTLIAGRYRTVSLLGRGGMGEVYRADDLVLGQTVALKFLPEAMAQNEPALARFYNEVRIARQVSHPNVCRVYDLGEWEGQPYLSMEYVDGEDLGSLLRRIGRLPGDKAVEIARKLCAGLSAAHDKGVLHRDLKPANIMLDARGQVLITDFGLAGLAAQIEGAEVRNGTPAYMAPEQLAGREVTIRSDIYALGLVLYEIFTGKRAFEAETIAELVRMQSQSTPVSMASMVKDLDVAVERVVLRCLDPDPKARPANALAVAMALPGGDPLAAALAAGETPSLGMVAAAGATEGMPVRQATIRWVLSLVGLLATVLLIVSASLLEQSSLDMPPAVLQAKSRELLAAAGYPDRPKDRASGLFVGAAYLDWIKDHDKPRPDWDKVMREGPSPVRFWYRESPEAMIPRDVFSESRAVGGVTRRDPPLLFPGMALVEMDPAGRLISLRVVPPEFEDPPGQPAPVDWKPLFQAAGLDIEKFEAAEPQWNPLGASDQRAAWKGVYPNSFERPIRVEAAAWRGKPVSFQVLGPWSKPAGAQRRPETTAEKVTKAFLLLLVIAALVCGLLLAWRHYQAGKGDLRGAQRLAAFILIMMLLVWVLDGHHVLDLGELATLSLAIGLGLLLAAVTFVLYLALEPYVRRYWPQSIISWARILTGHIRDPRVGKDVLSGVLLGALWGILFGAQMLLQRQQASTPMLGDVSAILRPASTMAHVAIMAMTTVQTVLMMFFVLFGLRVLLRKQWLALVAFSLVFAAPQIARADSLWIGVPVQLIAHALAGLVLVRYGIVSLAVGVFTANLLFVLPHTLHVDRWYFSYTAAVVLMLMALATYAYRTALGGRRVVTDRWLPE